MQEEPFQHKLYYEIQLKLQQQIWWNYSETYTITKCQEFNIFNVQTWCCSVCVAPIMWGVGVFDLIWCGVYMLQHF